MSSLASCGVSFIPLRVIATIGMEEKAGENKFCAISWCRRNLQIIGAGGSKILPASDRKHWHILVCQWWWRRRRWHPIGKPAESTDHNRAWHGQTRPKLRTLYAPFLNGGSCRSHRETDITAQQLAFSPSVRGMKLWASTNDDAWTSRLCRLDVKAPLHLIEKTIVFVDLLLYPIKFILLQMVHCENDRDKIDCHYEWQQISHQHSPVVFGVHPPKA